MGTFLLCFKPVITLFQPRGRAPLAARARGAQGTFRTKSRAVEKSAPSISTSLELSSPLPEAGSSSGSPASLPLGESLAPSPAVRR